MNMYYKMSIIRFHQPMMNLAEELIFHKIINNFFLFKNLFIFSTQYYFH